MLNLGKLLYRSRSRPRYCKCGAQLVFSKREVNCDRKTGKATAWRITWRCPNTNFYDSKHDIYQWDSKV